MCLLKFYSCNCYQTVVSYCSLNILNRLEVFKIDLSFSLSVQKINK